MKTKPLCIDLFCGLGGWSEGFLAEGWDCVGFDTERHDYGTGGCPGQLILQDVLTIHGSQFKTADCIVCSPPCQEYSYMAMPWSRAKAIAAEYRAGTRDVKKLTALFDACFRIQREASEAAGRHIPLVVENVRGAQPWVGRAPWNYGSFYLWGDIPALMPITMKRSRENGAKMPAGNCSEAMWKDRPIARLAHATPLEMERHGFKVPGFRFDGSGKSFQTASVDSTKVSGDWFGSYAEQKAAGTISPGRMHGKGSKNRKAASAAIAKIPFVLAQHIARVYKPTESK